MNKNKNKPQRPALFLDRDGTVIEEVGYLDSPDKIRLIPGAAETIRRFNERGWWVIILSNQSGVARGFFTEETLQQIHHRLVEMLSEQRAQVDALYYCPHHPQAEVAEYRIDCHCRKPNTGMLEKAAEAFPIDWGRSAMVGDKITDVLTGKALNLRSVLVLTGFGATEVQKVENLSVEKRPDFIARDIKEAGEYILRVTKSA